MTSSENTETVATDTVTSTSSARQQTAGDTNHQNDSGRETHTQSTAATATITTSSVSFSGEQQKTPATAGGTTTKRSASSAVQSQSDNTFLTGVKNEERHFDIPEPDSMHRVRKLQERVQGVVSTLNEKVSRVLQIQEKEFLEAYRGHMYTVQRELKMWQQKADEEAAKALRDAKVKRLEEECAWFRAESLRLDKYADAMKKDLESMREKVNSLEEDREWLEKQLKNTTKDNKILRSELENAISEKKRTEEKSLQREQEEQIEYFQDSDLEQTQTSTKIPSALPAIAGASTGTDEKSSQSYRGEDHSQAPHQRTSALQSRIEDLEAELSRCKTNLARERERVKQLREMSSGQTERTELEQFLQSCIDAVRSHIAARNSREGTDAPDVPTGAFSQFTTSDRRAVVMRLLEDDNVLETLHAVIFGHISSSTHESSKGGKSKLGEQSRSSRNTTRSSGKAQHP